MGTANSNAFIHHHFPPSLRQWEPLPANTLQQPYPSISTSINPILVDQHTLLIGQTYTINRYDSLQEQLQVLLFRKLNSSCIVTVLDAKLMSTRLPSIDCMLLNTQNTQSLQVVIEQIPYRLSDVGILMFEQMLYILLQSFKALHLLHLQFHKTFYIDEDLVCFNTRGECKLWVSQQLQRSKPNVQSLFTPNSIISQMFALLQARVDQRSIPQFYIKLKSKYQFQVFSQAIKFVQKVKKHQRINIDCIKSLRKQYPLSKGNLNNEVNKNIKSIPKQSYYQQNDLNQEPSNNKISRSKSIKPEKTYKFSLKNSRNIKNLVQSKIDHATLKTAVSRQKHSEVLQVSQHTELSLIQIQLKNQKLFDEVLSINAKSEKNAKLREFFRFQKQSSSKQVKVNEILTYPQNKKFKTQL